MVTTTPPHLSQLVDTDRYPLTDPHGAAWMAAVDRARGDLQAVGCTVLSGFLRPELLEDLRLECAAVAPQAYFDVEVVNVYNTGVDPSLPENHPVNTTVERGNAFVARDAIPTHAIISRLYRSPELQKFVAACFGLPAVHELADPLAGLCLNVLREGRSHPWHFDTNEFAVSLLTQEPAGGGLFEYCPGIRSADAENFDDVAGVLAGDERLVRRFALSPGDVQLFRGRHSLHRVTAVQGAPERHCAIFGYTVRPGVVGSVARTRQLFGRVLPEHLAAQRRAVRADALLD